jgi:hypothetical protein
MSGRLPQPSSSFNENAVVETPTGSRAASERLMAESRSRLSQMSNNLAQSRGLLNQMKASHAEASAGVEQMRATAEGAAAGLAPVKARVNALAAELAARKAAGRATSNASANALNTKYKELLQAKLAVRGPRRVTADEFATLRSAAFKQAYSANFAKYHNAKGVPTGELGGRVVRAPPRMTLNNTNFRNYKGGKKTRRAKRSTRRH